MTDKEKICGFFWLERHRTTGAEAYCAVILDRRRRKPTTQQFAAASAEELRAQLGSDGWEPQSDVAGLCERSVHVVGPVVDRPAVVVIPVAAGDALLPMAARAGLGRMPDGGARPGLESGEGDLARGVGGGGGRQGGDFFPRCSHRLTVGCGGLVYPPGDD